MNGAPDTNGVPNANAASDAGGALDANGTPDESRTNSHGASDARINRNAVFDTINGASDANGAPDARVNQDALDATHGQHHGQPQRRTEGVGRTRRRASWDNTMDKSVDLPPTWS